MNPFDEADGAEFPESMLAAEGDDFQGRLRAAGGAGLPNLAETAAAQEVEQPITGNRLIVAAVDTCHGSPRDAASNPVAAVPLAESHGTGSHARPLRALQNTWLRSWIQQERRWVGAREHAADW